MGKSKILTHLFHRFTMITDLWLMQDGIAEGHAIVIDMQGSSLSHLAKVGIIGLKKFMFYIQVSYLNSDAYEIKQSSLMSF